LCRFGWHPPRRLTCRKEDTACRRVHGGRQLKAPDPNAPNGTVRASHATSETRGSHSAASSFASVMRCCSAAVSRPFGQLETELLLLIERERGLIRRNKLRHTSNDRVQRLLLAWEYLDDPRMKTVRSRPSAAEGSTFQKGSTILQEQASEAEEPRLNAVGPVKTHGERMPSSQAVIPFHAMAAPPTADCCSAFTTTVRLIDNARSPSHAANTRRSTTSEQSGSSARGFRASSPNTRTLVGKSLMNENPELLFLGFSAVLAPSFQGC
jgi:hypothetical protein